MHLLIRSIFLLLSVVLFFKSQKISDWHHWFFKWHFSIPILVIDGINLYLIVILFEAALRSEGKRMSGKDYVCFELPNLNKGLILSFLLFGAVFFAFGSVYIDSGEIISNAEETLSSKLDAAYFSMVTFTTLGYGDYAPIKNARFYVIWQLITAVLLLTAGFSLVLDRLSSFGKNGIGNQERKENFDSQQYQERTICLEDGRFIFPDRGQYFYRVENNNWYKLEKDAQISEANTKLKDLNVDLVITKLIKHEIDKYVTITRGKKKTN